MEDSKLERSTSSEPVGQQNLHNNGGEEQRRPEQHAGSLEHAESPNEGLLHADDSAAIAGEFSEKETPTLESNGEDDAGREALDVKEEVGADGMVVRPSKRSRIKVELGETVVHGGGEADVNCVVYKVGDQRQALVQLWKEHELLQGGEGIEASQNGPTLEVRIPAKHVTSTNRHVKSGRLWGTDVYTVDSDLVAVLMHIGYCRRTASPPSSATEELRVTVRVLAPQDCYISTVRNNVHSRAWRAPIDCSYRVERCCFVKQGGEIIDLEPCLQHSSNIEPTFVPVFLENKKITRAAALKALAQKRFLSSMRFQYSFSMEPWYEYSINIVADQGLKAPLYTSARLKKGEVLYVETLFGR
ncbi:Unknown protein [Striga hermonthica]|uniref:Uncharacterized protein n=1 Tax=Striga hermonthica TaxID=68872 RepID=A0A9N7RL41_STRHE|nr:Unknown protein [Striga hermonthica]